MTRKGCIFILFVVTAVWVGVVRFWFHNVDLSYIHQYIDIVDPLGQLDVTKIIRGHVLLHLPLYLIFGHTPAPYYVTALVLHAFVAALVFCVVNIHLKNPKIAIASSLFFGVSMTYVNVLFEGAFNLYYPFLALLFLLAHLATLRRSLTGLIVATILGFAVRETTLVMPIIVLLSIVSFSPRREWRAGVTRYVVPVVALCLGYLVVRSSVLGSLKSDLTDDAVQFRYALLSSGRYLEYITSVGVNAFRMFAEQVFTPYVLYSTPMKLSMWNSAAVGAVLFFAMLYLLLFSFKKADKKVKRIMIFGFAWMAVFNLFISSVLPFPQHVIEQPYTVDSVLSRYNYYGVIGLTFYLAGIIALSMRRKIALTFVLMLVVLNAGLIQKAQSELYIAKHAKAKDFYATVFESYPTLPPRVVIYYNFFQVNDLKDYIGDLVWIFAKTRYPKTQFILETTASHVQEEYKKGNYKKEELFAFDLDENGFVRDFSSTFRNSLDARTYSVSGLQYPPGLYANKNTIIQLEGRTQSSAPMCPSVLSDYWKSLEIFTKNATVTTSSQYGDYPRFSFVTPQSLIDTQLSGDFYWQADVVDLEPSIVLNIGSTREINAVAWEGEVNGNSIPRDYSLSVSLDGDTWTTVHTVTKNTLSSRIDSFPSIAARYVKISVSSTSLGQPVKFTEINALQLPGGFFASWKSMREVEEYLVTSGCIFESLNSPKNILARVVSTTDAGSTKAYNQVLVVGRGVYIIPVVHLEMRSSARSIFEEKLDHFIIESGPHTQNIWEKVLISQ